MPRQLITVALGGRPPSRISSQPISAPALGGQVLFDLADEIALQLVFVLQSLGLDAGLALGAILPTGLGTFVAADVDEGRGEQPHHFIEHVVQEREGGVVARAIDILFHTPAGADLERPARAGELRIGGQGPQRMARHLDLGHDGHVPPGRISHDLADIVLGVETAVAFAVALGLIAPGADFRELGILLDLDPPALVFGEVPVQRVQLVGGQQVDAMFDERLAEEVPAFVQQQSPPGKPAAYLRCGSRALAISRRPACVLAKTAAGRSCRSVCPP